MDTKIGGDKKKMKGIKVNLIAVIVVLAVISFISPVSAHSIDQGTVNENCPHYTWWNYTVTCDEDPAISHWVVFWCNEAAVEEVWLDTITDQLQHCDDVEGEACWEYMTATHPDPNTGLQGIKIDDYEFEDDRGLVNVAIKLSGCYVTSDDVAYTIKSGSTQSGSSSGGSVIYGYDLDGPSACDSEIPEFSTIAIPVAMILGLLFFFNHRKKRGE